MIDRRMRRRRRTNLGHLTATAYSQEDNKGGFIHAQVYLDT